MGISPYPPETTRCKTGSPTYRARGRLGVAEKSCLLAFHPDDASSLAYCRGEVTRTGTNGGAWRDGTSAPSAPDR